MQALDALFRPVATILNRNIAELTPARELCARLDGRIVAVRVRDTSLALFFEVSDETVALAHGSAREPDAVICGSLLTLARVASSGGERALRDGSLELTGDAGVAAAFQDLLACARPDVEEELSRVVGDAAAHRIGEIVRGVGEWARASSATMTANLREYLQEESREAPSRYEVKRFAADVDALRDDVERLAARIARLDAGL